MAKEISSNGSSTQTTEGEAVHADLGGEPQTRAGAEDPAGAAALDLDERQRYQRHEDAVHGEDVGEPGLVEEERREPEGAQRILHQQAPVLRLEAEAQRPRAVRKRGDVEDEAQVREVDQPSPGQGLDPDRPRRLAPQDPPVDQSGDESREEDEDLRGARVPHGVPGPARDGKSQVGDGDHAEGETAQTVDPEIALGFQDSPRAQTRARRRSSVDGHRSPGRV
jgi:hypothetical protein